MKQTKSTLSLVTKGLTAPAPRLIGADYGTRGGEFWNFNSVGGFDYKFSYTGHTSAVDAFRKCSPLTSVITKKAKEFVNGKTWILNTTGANKGKEATNSIAVNLRKLLAKPNPFQSQREFEAQQYIYSQLFGFCIMLPIKPVGYDNIEATSLWNIPPSMIDMEETQKSWLMAEKRSDVVKKIVLVFGAERVALNADDIYIIKDFIPSFNSPMFPESRLVALEAQVNNIIGAYESRNVLINYRGALGIISPDSKDTAGMVPLRDEDKESLQSDFMRYGLKNTQWKFIISNAAVKWSSMGVPTKDLMLFEEIEDDIMRICDAYDYPYPLMSSNRTNSLGGNNITASETRLYQGAIIPESISYAEQWTNCFNLEKYGLEIVKDFSAAPPLQKDKVREATALNILNDAKKKEFDAGLITLDQWLQSLGEDPLPDGIGQVRATDVKNSNVPLAVTIGVGGVQGLIALVTAQGMTPEAKQAALEIVFGLAAADAQRMAQQPAETTTTQPNDNQQ